MAKRLFDMAVAAAALVLLVPVLAAAAVAVAFSSPGPVLFRQTRVGRGGERFTLLKFRSMRMAPGASITVAGDRRVTRVGEFLRRYKLDELPQLWNVLLGDMSLVGPRPEVERYVDLKAPLWRAVLAVRPGITDPASLVYRNEEQVLAAQSDPHRYYVEVLLPRKLELSAGYAASRTLATDLKILFLTAVASAAPSALDASRLERQFAPAPSPRIS